MPQSRQTAASKHVGMVRPHKKDGKGMAGSNFTRLLGRRAPSGQGPPAPFDLPRVSPLTDHSHQTSPPSPNPPSPLFPPFSPPSQPPAQLLDLVAILPVEGVLLQRRLPGAIPGPRPHNGPARGSQQPEGPEGSSASQGRPPAQPHSQPPGLQQRPRHGCPSPPATRLRPPRHAAPLRSAEGQRRRSRERRYAG